MSEILKMRSAHQGLRIKRGRDVLPEITPSKVSHAPAQEHPAAIASVPATPAIARQEEALNLDTLRQQEFRRGVLAGKKQAEEAIRQEWEEKLDQERARVDALLASIQEQLGAFYGSTEQAVMKFSFGIAERIIRREIQADRQMVVEQIREGVRRVVGVDSIKIRIHPEDLVLVREQKGSIQAAGDALREVVVDGDDSLEPGDCIIESDMGNIDARVATQLKQLETVLFEGRSGS